jgi:hypothetical protein
MFSDHRGVYSYVERRVRGATCSKVYLVVKVYWPLANRIFTQHWISNFQFSFQLIRSFMNARKAVREIECSKIEHTVLVLIILPEIALVHWIPNRNPVRSTGRPKESRFS